MYIEVAKMRLYPAAVMLTSIMGSFFSPVYAADKPHEQQFVVTAYYSPVPNQCCYFRGSYEEEIAFNGKGTNGADGTEVYTGMIAAPSTYDFGTVIELPGLGVGAVHDRGGRIVEWGEDIHRIDLWMGKGEEGLARAMAWGVRRVNGTVYPIGSGDMPKEKFSLDSIPADTATLSALPKSDTTLVLMQAKFGDQTYAVRALQNVLKDIGYFDGAVTGQFGEVTQQSLRRFLAVTGLPGDDGSVNDLTAAALVSAQAVHSENLPDLSVGLQLGVSGQDVRQAQKLLRYLGYYHGRTDGLFDEDVKASVTAFQMDAGIIKRASDDGAGRIGPATQASILSRWKGKIVQGKAFALRTKMHVAADMKDRGMPSKVLASGDHGTDVKQLQSFLKDIGYLETKDVTGTFGARTRKALLTYQLDRKIIGSESAHGAGIFGPSTRQIAFKDAVDSRYKQMRAGTL